MTILKRAVNWMEPMVLYIWFSWFILPKPALKSRRNDWSNFWGMLKIAISSSWLQINGMFCGF